MKKPYQAQVQIGPAREVIDVNAANQKDAMRQIRVTYQQKGHLLTFDQILMIRRSDIQTLKPVINLNLNQK